MKKFLYPFRWIAGFIFIIKSSFLFAISDGEITRQYSGLAGKQKIDKINEILNFNEDLSSEQIKKFSSISFNESKKINYQIGVIEALINKVKANLQLSKMKSAADDLPIIFKLSFQNNYQIGIARAYNLQGLYYLFQNKADSSLRKFSQSIFIFEKLKEKKFLINGLIRMGYSYSYFYNDYSKSLEYLKRALQISEELKDTAQIVKVYNLLAYNFLNNLLRSFDQNSFKSFKAYCEKGIYISQKAKKTKSLAKLYGFLGTGFKEVNNDSSLHYFNKELETANKINDDKTIIDAMSNIGGCYAKNKQFEKAIDYYTKASALDAQKGFEQDMYVLYLEIGSCNAELNHVDKALDYYNKAYNYFKTNDIIINEVQALTYLAELNLAQIKNYHEADKLYLQAYNLIKKNNLTDFLQLVLSKLVQVNIRLNNQDKAIQYQDIYTSSIDSVMLTNKSAELARLSTRFDIENQMREEKIRMEEQARIETAARKHLVSLQYSGIALTVLFLFIVFFIIGKFNFSATMIDGMSFVLFLLLFEFILVFLDPYVDNITNSQPIYKLGINILLALVITPIHEWLEHFIIKTIVKHEVNT